MILGANHTVTESEPLVTTACVQHLDGHVDDGCTGSEGPSIYLDSNPDVGLNSDQARELAALLLKLTARGRVGDPVTTTTHIPDLPIPAGATADDWPSITADGVTGSLPCIV